MGKTIIRPKNMKRIPTKINTFLSSNLLHSGPTEKNKRILNTVHSGPSEKKYILDTLNTGPIVKKYISYTSHSGPTVKIKDIKY